MCKLKSGIILKDCVYIGGRDSHDEMLQDLKIKDTQRNAELFFIRAELYPKDGDVFSDPENWVYRVDQDILPEWYVKEVDKLRFIAAVKEWYRAHVFVGVDDLKIEPAKTVYLKNVKTPPCGETAPPPCGKTAPPPCGETAPGVFQTIVVPENVKITS